MAPVKSEGLQCAPEQLLEKLSQTFSILDLTIQVFAGVKNNSIEFGSTLQW